MTPILLSLLSHKANRVSSIGSDGIPLTGIAPMDHRWKCLVSVVFMPQSLFETKQLDNNKEKKTKRLCKKNDKTLLKAGCLIFSRI